MIIQGDPFSLMTAIAYASTSLFLLYNEYFAKIKQRKSIYVLGGVLFLIGFISSCFAQG